MKQMTVCNTVMLPFHSQIMLLHVLMYWDYTKKRTKRFWEDPSMILQKENKENGLFFNALIFHTAKMFQKPHTVIITG